MRCDDENSLTSSSITLDIPSLHRVGVDADVVDGTLEYEEDEDEVD